MNRIAQIFYLKNQVLIKSALPGIQGIASIFTYSVSSLDSRVSILVSRLSLLALLILLV
jgi:hypothetical protein